MLRNALLALMIAAPRLVVAQDVPDCGLYTYRADVVRVIDGDTVVMNIDLGFRTWLHDEHLRLYGIDAPERGSAAAEAATWWRYGMAERA